jgi:hypothetical protein
MEHSTAADFQLGEAVADRETAEQGEVIAVDYDEVLEEYIYLLISVQTSKPLILADLCNQG